MVRSKHEKTNNRIGSSLDDFLKEEGIFEEARAAALKEVLEWQALQFNKKIDID